MNKFEQVSSDGHQMSLAGGYHVPCRGLDWGKGRGPSTVRSNASWVMITRGQNNGQT